MGRKVRVLATTRSVDGRRRVAYAAEIFDDEDPGWVDGSSCGHAHPDLESAYACALGMDRREVQQVLRRALNPVKPSGA